MFLTRANKTFGLTRRLKVVLSKVGVTNFFGK